MLNNCCRFVSWHALEVSCCAHFDVAAIFKLGFAGLKLPFAGHLGGCIRPLHCCGQQDGSHKPFRSKQGEARAYMSLSRVPIELTSHVFSCVLNCHLSLLQAFVKYMMRPHCHKLHYKVGLLSLQESSQRTFDSLEGQGLKHLAMSFDLKAKVISIFAIAERGLALILPSVLL